MLLKKKKGKWREQIKIENRFVCNFFLYLHVLELGTQKYSEDMDKSYILF